MGDGGRESSERATGEARRWVRRGARLTPPGSGRAHAGTAREDPHAATATLPPPTYGYRISDRIHFEYVVFKRYRLWRGTV